MSETPSKFGGFSISVSFFAILLLCSIVSASAVREGQVAAKRLTAARPQSHVVNANGIQIRYLEWGRQGSPVVLVHGLYDTARIWSSFASLLAANHRVIAPDRRGAGRSEKPVSGYDHETLARDLESLIKNLNLDAVTLIGHSFGGEVALTLAAMNPGIVHSLVLIEGGYFPKPAPPKDGLLPPPPCKAKPDECKRRAMLEKAIHEYDAERLYARVSSPTLLVMGIPPLKSGTDAQLVKQARQHIANVAQNRLRKGKAAALKDANHWVQQDQPKALAETIEDFLRGRGGKL